GWSLMQVLPRELSQAYGAYLCGEASPLAPLPVQYADYALWQRGWLQGEVFQQHLQYWREQLHGAPAALQLPTDHDRPSVQSFRGATLPFRLSGELSEALIRLAHREDSTLFMVLLAAWQ